MRRLKSHFVILNESRLCWWFMMIVYTNVAKTILHNERVEGTELRSLINE